MPRIGPVELKDFRFSRREPFYDNFQGVALNTAKWVVYNRIGDLVNSEVNGVLPANVVVNNGLSIVSQYVPAGYAIGDSQNAPQTVFYSSGQISANFLFKYGTATIRSKCPGGTGLWPLFWLLGFEWQASQPYTANIPGANWPIGGWCEMDIMEFLANSRTTNNCAVWHEADGTAVGATVPFDATTRYMVWRLEWYPNLLRWSIDAEDGNGFVILRTITDPTKIPSVLMYPIISTAVGGTGGGTPNSATFPQTYSIDYVRITT